MEERERVYTTYWKNAPAMRLYFLFLETADTGHFFFKNMPCFKPFRSSRLSPDTEPANPSAA